MSQGSVGLAVKSCVMCGDEFIDYFPEKYWV